MAIKIEVKRERASVTQGRAAVYVNDQKIISFGDDIYLDNGDGTFTNGFKTVENVQHYGKVISGWGSITPDSGFIMGLLYHPYDNLYHHSELFKKAILKADGEVKNNEY